MAQIRILLADDHTIIRSGLRLLLEQQSDFTVIAEANNGREAVELVSRHKPEVAILDIGMPELNGIDTARQLSRLCPDIPILMVTVDFSKQLAAAAQSVGIRGACAKSEVASIVEGVEALLHQETYFPEISAMGV